MAEAIHSVRRAQLEEERERLRAQLAELGHGPNGSLSFDEGFADSSQVTAERGEIEALGGRLAEALRDVDDALAKMQDGTIAVAAEPSARMSALAKMQDGTYGRCESCGDEIGDARLDAMPVARLCIKCASKSH